MRGVPTPDAVTTVEEALASVIDFSPVLRENLAIPDDQLIVCGLALGYADQAHRLNHQHTPHEPTESFATCYD